MIKQNKILTLHELFKFCEANGVFRLVKVEENDSFVKIIICGVYQIRLNKKTQKVTLHTWFFTNLESGEWRVRKSLPNRIPCFWKNENIYNIQYWLQSAVTHVIDSIVKSNYSISGICYMYKSFYGGIETKILLEDIQPNFDTTSEMFEEKTFFYPHYLAGMSMSKMRHDICIKIMTRINAFINNETQKYASMSLSKNIWKVIDKGVFSLYGKAHFNSFVRNSILDANFLDYYKFSKQIRINDNVDYKGLWLMIGFLRKQKKSNYHYTLTGKIKDLYKELQLPESISYGDFKYMYTLKPSLIAQLIEFISLRDRYRFGINDKIKIIMKLLRQPEIKKYPTKAIFDFLETVWNGLRVEHGYTSVYRIALKWLDYHQDLYKNIGYKSVTRRWNTELNRFAHAIEWVFNTDFYIQKNQSLASIYRLSEEWVEELNHDDYDYAEISPQWNGIDIDWQSCISEMTVSEITTLEQLKKEGQEMHHCVYSYAHDCANETYRVFTIINNDERATLGISQVENHKIFKFDQVMGVSNSAVSSEIIKMSKKVLNQVNSKINKVNLINLGE